MKLIISLIGISFSLSAFACPNLTGKWSCTESSGRAWTEDVTQRDIPNGVAYQSVNEKGEVFEVSVDGVTRTTQDKDGTITETYTCNGDIGVIGKVIYNYNDGSKLDGHVEMTLSGPDKFETVSGSHYSYDGKQYDFNYKGTCTRQ